VARVTYTVELASAASWRVRYSSRHHSRYITTCGNSIVISLLSTRLRTLPELSFYNQQLGPIVSTYTGLPAWFRFCSSCCYLSYLSVKLSRKRVADKLQGALSWVHRSTDQALLRVVGFESGFPPSSVNACPDWQRKSCLGGS
jgi:hypothetical protein